MKREAGSLAVMLLWLLLTVLVCYLALSLGR